MVKKAVKKKRILTMARFETAVGLCKFINDNEIKQKDIQDLNNSRLWFYVWYWETKNGL